MFSPSKIKFIHANNFVKLNDSFVVDFETEHTYSYPFVVNFLDQDENVFEDVEGQTFVDDFKLVKINIAGESIHYNFTSHEVYHSISVKITDRKVQFVKVAIFSEDKKRIIFYRQFKIYVSERN